MHKSFWKNSHFEHPQKKKKPPKVSLKGKKSNFFIIWSSNVCMCVFWEN
jgi:hypothetical protein